jgi:hypothetical protein
MSHVPHILRLVKYGFWLYPLPSLVLVLLALPFHLIRFPSFTCLNSVPHIGQFDYSISNFYWRFVLVTSFHDAPKRHIQSTGSVCLSRKAIVLLFKVVVRIVVPVLA